MNYSSRSGVTLIGIIAAIVVMGLLGAGVLMLVSTGSMESIQTLNWGQAFYAAESGVSAARHYVRTHASLPANAITGMVGRASFAARVDAEGKIVSVGQQDDASWTSIYAGMERRMLAVYHVKSAQSPRYRTWSSLSGLSSNALDALPDPRGQDFQWQRIVASPVADEYLLAAQDDGRWISAQAYTNGAWFANTLLNAAGAAPDAGARGFDIAYENLTGRGLAVYSVGTANPQYRLWVSNRWSSAVSMDVGADDPVQWIRLVSKPGADEIMCLARWNKTVKKVSGNYSSATVWNGSGWSGLIALENNCASEIACESMDAAYATNTALVVYVNGATAAQQQAPKYRTYTAGSWSAERTMATLNAMPCWIRVEYSADGDQAYACFLKSGAKLQGAFWDGSAWGGYNTFGGVTLETVDRRCFDIAWSSRTNTLMAAYCRQNQNAHSYMIATEGGSSASYGTMESTDDGLWSVLRADPFSSDFYYLALDDKNDVNLQKWDGAAWTNYPELEVNSELDYNSIDMAFGR